MNSPASTFLFHKPEFIFRPSEQQIVTFEVPGARIYFSRAENLLTSLDKSPFGGFILTSGSSREDLISLLKKVAAWSEQNEIANVIIRSFPEIYQPVQSHLVKNCLLEFGFSVKYEDTSQVIPVSEGSMTLDTHKKRRLRHAALLAFTFRQLTSEYLDEAYLRIVESRESKGYPVTMTQGDLQEMFKLFPNEYLLFGVFSQDTLIATSVCVKVNSEILYCFYIGDALAYRHASPVTLLIHGIFEYCKENNFTLIDLGISTDKGVVNKGLYTFKKSFGTIDSPKLTFLKQF
ncbi:MAG TPA: GNAT family N-acetyltransferase [Chryseolinea sp.]